MNSYEKELKDTFKGLVPTSIIKGMKSIGFNEKSTKLLELDHRGHNSLMIIDEIATAFDKQKGPDYSGNNKNDAAGESIIDAMTNASGSSVVITIPEGETLSSLNIPEDVTNYPKITGELADGAVITSNSSKVLYINNTSEEPVDVTINANNSVYLSGKFNNVNLNGKYLGKSGDTYPVIHGDVNVNENLTATGITIIADFVGEDSTVNYNGTSNLTVSNQNEVSSVEVNAPNATVTMIGQYDELVASVSENTLILNKNFHANTLRVLKGNVLYKGLNASDFADEIITDGEIGPFINDFKTSIADAGVYALSESKSGNGITFTVLASGKFEFRLNGYTYNNTSTRTGTAILLASRGGIEEINIVGPGKLTTTGDNYGVWNSCENGVMNIYNAEIEGYTHVIYCEKGTINVYGGTFRMLGDNNDLDVNGNYKFLVNCYDANYTSGKAKINIYGGKFYQFNPAEAYGEPTSPVSYVANGYHVVESTENGVKVYEVVKD